MASSTLQDPQHDILRSPQAFYEAKYRRALEHFRSLSDEYRRTTYCGREFIIVSEVTRRLREKSGSLDHELANDLEHLRITAHHRHSTSVPRFRTKDFDEYQSVFYTLVELDYPQYINKFLDNGLDDQKLPISLDDLQRMIKTDHNGFHEQFLQVQYRWCPLVFDINMNSNGSTLDRIIPLCHKEKIEPRRGIYARPRHISTLWKVEVPEELVTSRLQEQVKHARIKREIENTDGETVYVRVPYIDLTWQAFLANRWLYSTTHSC